MSSALRPLVALLVAVTLGLIAACGGQEGGCEGDACAPSGRDVFNAERAFSDLERQVNFGPRPSGSQANAKQVRFLERRLQLAGARDVSVQAPWQNVVATIPGEGEGTVLIAAHHDTKDIDGFVGANDGASGVAVVLEIARALAAEPDRDGPTVRVALFDAEEARGDADFEADGTRGSRQYVEQAEADSSLAELDEMILFDMVGDCELQIPREANSDAALYGRLEDEASELSGAESPLGGETSSILDDHIPFVEAGIPSVDLIDFTYGSESSPGPFWHTTDDTLEKVCPESLDAVGEPVLRLLGVGG